MFLMNRLKCRGLSQHFELAKRMIVPVYTFISVKRVVSGFNTFLRYRSHEDNV
ncbi:hypothetical protein [Bartonella koehlerae]|uniref:Uncharacterized protein n=1 Tax=Bartonella koehlerae C-29 TaxID=1134510 RepID=A0A067W7E5_9HYPH|nr:hypothetical protein [Bartonella koehlerae]KEC54781.1 hypothetical protein O9A_01395 [Bartonella koehlerae C-29]